MKFKLKMKTNSTYNQSSIMESVTTNTNFYKNFFEGVYLSETYKGRSIKRIFMSNKTFLKKVSEVQDRITVFIVPIKDKRYFIFAKYSLINSRDINITLFDGTTSSVNYFIENTDILCTEDKVRNQIFDNELNIFHERHILEFTKYLHKKCKVIKLE